MTETTAKTTTTTKYGLMVKATGKVLEYEVRDNTGREFCVLETHVLTEHGDGKPWLVDTPENAEWVRHNSTE